MLTPQLDYLKKSVAAAHAIPQYKRRQIPDKQASSMHAKNTNTIILSYRVFLFHWNLNGDISPFEEGGIWTMYNPSDTWRISCLL
jgi:hypothetical protein